MSRRLEFVLAGDPVAHSRSPAIHTRALATAGLDGSYEAIRTDASGLARMVMDLREGLIDGINVTMPLKGAAAALCDVLTPVASLSGSVNTLRSRDGLVEGHSTDAIAIADVLEGSGLVPAVLVLGSGDSARAALSVARPTVTYLSARRVDAAAQIATRFDARPLRWGVPVAGAVVINATPLGMKGEALPDLVVGLASMLLDLPYGQGVTPASKTAIRTGVRVVDGIEFLARQAAAAFEWWTGLPVDFAVLDEVARNN